MFKSCRTRTACPSSLMFRIDHPAQISSQIYYDKFISCVVPGSALVQENFVAALTAANNYWQPMVEMTLIPETKNTLKDKPNA